MGEGSRVQRETTEEYLECLQEEAVTASQYLSPHLLTAYLPEEQVRRWENYEPPLRQGTPYPGKEGV